MTAVPPDWSALAECRRKLDDVDAEIMRLFGERYAIRRQVKTIKQAHGLPVIDPVRAQQVIDQALQNAARHDVPTDFAQALYQLVIDHSHKFEAEKRDET